MAMKSAPAFSSSSYIGYAIYSCIFRPCNSARIAFSTPAFSVAPLTVTKIGPDLLLKVLMFNMHEICSFD